MDSALAEADAQVGRGPPHRASAEVSLNKHARRRTIPSAEVRAFFARDQCDVALSLNASIPSRRFDQTRNIERAQAERRRLLNFWPRPIACPPAPSRHAAAMLQGVRPDARKTHKDNRQLFFVT
jgi:hypothetical protein